MLRLIGGLALGLLGESGQRKTQKEGERSQIDEAEKLRKMSPEDRASYEERKRSEWNAWTE